MPKFEHILYLHTGKRMAIRRVDVWLLLQSVASLLRRRLSHGNQTTVTDWKRRYLQRTVSIDTTKQLLIWRSFTLRLKHVTESRSINVTKFTT